MTMFQAELLRVIATDNFDNRQVKSRFDVSLCGVLKAVVLFFWLF